MEVWGWKENGRSPSPLSKIAKKLGCDIIKYACGTEAHVFRKLHISKPGLLPVVTSAEREAFAEKSVAR